MRTRASLGAIILMLGVLAAACGDGNGSSNDDGGAADGGSDRTVATAEFVEQANDACRQANQEAAGLDQPSTDPGSPDLTPEDLAEGASYLDRLVPIYESLVAELDDMPQPDDEADAQSANQLVDDLGTVLQDLRALREAATDGDVSAVNRAWETVTTNGATFAQAADAFGLAECTRLN